MSQIGFSKNICHLSWWYEILAWVGGDVDNLSRICILPPGLTRSDAQGCCTIQKLMVGHLSISFVFCFGLCLSAVHQWTTIDDSSSDKRKWEQNVSLLDFFFCLPLLFFFSRNCPMTKSTTVNHWWNIQTDGSNGLEGALTVPMEITLPIANGLPHTHLLNVDLQRHGM